VAYVTFFRSEPAFPVHAQEPRSAPATTVPTIRLVPSVDQPERFEVHGLSPTTLDSIVIRAAIQPPGEPFFSVSVAPAEGSEPTPMLGKYRVENDVLIFEPRFPLTRGVTYLAWLDPAIVRKPLVAERFTIPNPRPAVATVVREIFPTSSELPENQLKFYIYFSAPMSRGQAYRHIRLLKEDGRPVEGAFLEIAEELWNRDATRFMLLLDPGRVKRELKPREEDGPVLEEGHQYTLVVDSAWPDAAGFELEQTVRKSFSVLAPDDVPPDPNNWQLQPPTNEEHSLVVQFPEPLDRALLERVLWVETSKGLRLDGQVTIDRHETRWQFHPSSPWQPSERYSLATERILEDRAGNRIGRKFEVDIFEKIEPQVTSEVLRLPFRLSGNRP
jgi:hypothetical protein